MDRRKRRRLLSALQSGILEDIRSVSNTAIASFTGDGRDLVRLVVGIEPVQAGSGDPSPDNICPISGWTECKVTRTGKNLFSPHIYKGIGYSQAVGETVTLTDSPVQLTDNQDGTFTYTTSSTWDSNIFLLPVKQNISYFRSVTIASSANLGTGYGYLDGDFKVLSYSNSTTNPRTLSAALGVPAEAKYMFLLFTNRTSASATITITNPQVELGSTATAYEPYQGETYTIDLDGTRYGGTLDVTSGKLTVTKAIVDLGSLTWGYARPFGGNNWFLYTTGISGLAKFGTATVAANALCEIYPITYANDLNNNYASQDFVACLYNNWIVVHDSRYTDVDAYKTAMSGIHLAYELATPIEVDLTPTQIITLSGANNIWADTGDIILLEYMA